ncbi:MAG TPA: hypothetical protein VFI87_05390 [Hyphomicrobiaceae bacterium]|jgi:hypothetical protein|nr:hypothetical protein [Hyphomicrobiaceae bacterium]
MTRVNNAVDLGLEAPENSDVDQLLHPARFYARPDDVVTDELLTIEERRAILSSWASDACAVESNPPLRRPWFAPSPVTFDEVMDALLRLDCMTRTAAAAFVERVLANSPADR